MTLVPKREYVVLLLGDVAVLTVALWLALALRHFEFPSQEAFWSHLVPFSLLFVVWVGVFFLAGLYGKHTRLFRSRLPATIFYTQLINVIIAALFFFFIPFFGIAPKTVLVLYLLVSFILIFLWRVGIFPKLRTSRRLKGVLLASGADAEALAHEIEHDRRYPFGFSHVIDTKKSLPSDVIREACRVVGESEISFIVVDFSDKAVATAMPIIYDAAFNKPRFAFVDVIDLYQEVFDRVPLTLVSYEWVLESLSASRAYDVLKRFLDIVITLIVGVIAIVLAPFIALAIKLDDGGPVFIFQDRIGRYQKHIRILKFRSMSGNDQGDYSKKGRSELRVTRVGKWLRLLRVDELPQLWNILRGDLSLVGPRPELPKLAAEYSAKIPYYNARHLVGPGLSGWAQILHDRHPHHGAAIAETKEKLSYDLYYLRHRSLSLDLFIALSTIRIVLTARGT